MMIQISITADNQQCNKRSQLKNIYTDLYLHANDNTGNPLCN